MTTTPRSTKSPWPGWIMRVGLPMVLLLTLASIVPIDKWWSRAAAQLAAVVVPLGIEWVGHQWSRRRDRETSIAEFRSRLEPLTAQPRGAIAGLDDPAYRIARYWGRTTVHQRLNAARSQTGPAVILVGGGPWTGKTRLVTEWTSTLPDDVVAGWLPTPGDSQQLIQDAKRLGVPAVLLHRGSDADLAGALTALAVAEEPITLVVERRDMSHLAVSMRALSPTAGRIAETATKMTIESPGSATDLDYRYGDMVEAYERAAGKPRSGTPGRPLRKWTTEPIGLVNAWAMFEALRLGTSTGALSPMEAFAEYWKTLRDPWLQKPAARFGLPPLSNVQLETALVLHLLTNGEAESAIKTLSFFDKLATHEVQQLTAWAQEMTSSAGGRSTELATVAVTQPWTENQQRSLGAALQTSRPRALVHAVRLCVITEQVLGETPTITRWVVGSDINSLTVTLNALVDELTTPTLDTLIATQVSAAALTLDQVKDLLSRTTFDRMPHTHVTLMRRQLKQLPTDFSAEQRGPMLIELAVRSGELGRHQESLPLAEEAVAIYRRLADPTTGNPDRYAPALAGSLINLALHLGELGRHQKALLPAEEAVVILRRLADPATGNPDRYNPDFAASLTNLAIILDGLGRHPESLLPAEEAVAIHRRLADPATGNPDRYAPALAGSLNNLATRLAELGRHQEALSPAEEAIAVFRRLADPDRHDPELANSLANLAVHLGELGRHHKALSPVEEAVAIHRRLADPTTGNPDRYAPALAGSLNNLATRLGQLGRHHKALSPVEEAVAIHRRLADPTTGNPDRYAPVLANSLSNFAVHLSELGRHNKALLHDEETVTIYRRLADPTTGNPDRYAPALAHSLNNFAVHLDRLGRPHKALLHDEEAIAIHRHLADPTTGNPDRYAPALAHSLNNLSTRLAQLGQHPEALSPAKEAVAIHRHLADPTTGNPDRYAPALAGSLANLAARLAQLGQHREALRHAKEAAAIYRELADLSTDNPNEYRPKLKIAEHEVVELKLLISEAAVSRVK